MRLSAFSRPIPQLVVLSLLGLMIVSPANAQSSSEPELGAFALGAGTINPGTQDTGPYATTPETNEKVELSQAPILDPVLPRIPESNGNVESEPDTQPQPGPYAATPAPETNEKVNSAGTQPESNPSTAQPESEATSANSEQTQDGSQF